MAAEAGDIHQSWLDSHCCHMVFKLCQIILQWWAGDHKKLWNHRSCPGYSHPTFCYRRRLSASRWIQGDIGWVTCMGCSNERWGCVRIVQGGCRTDQLICHYLQHIRKSMPRILIVNATVEILLTIEPRALPAINLVKLSSKFPSRVGAQVSTCYSWVADAAVLLLYLIHVNVLIAFGSLVNAMVGDFHYCNCMHQDLMNWIFS